MTTTAPLEAEEFRDEMLLIKVQLLLQQQQKSHCSSTQ